MKKVHGNRRLVLEREHIQIILQRDDLEKVAGASKLTVCLGITCHCVTTVDL